MVWTVLEAHDILEQAAFIEERFCVAKSIVMDTKMIGTVKSIGIMKAV